MKGTILVDVHDTVLDLVGPWLRRYNRDYDDILTHEDLKSWEMPDWVSGECGKKIYEYLGDPTLFGEMQPIEGALAGVEMLRRMGHRVVFVTAASGPGYLPTISALVRHGFIPSHYEQRDVVSAADKSLIRGDIIIDDRPATIENFPGGKILFDRPWNRNLEMTTLGHRARGWREMDVIVDLMTMNREMGVAA